jgi:hypothetical protein
MTSATTQRQSNERRKEGGMVLTLKKARKLKKETANETIKAKEEGRKK